MTKNQATQEIIDYFTIYLLSTVFVHYLMV